MEQVQIEILTQTITAQYGTLEAGVTLRTTAAFAKHLVEDCMAAKYARPSSEKTTTAKAEGPAVQTSAQTVVAPASLSGGVGIDSAAASMQDVQTSAQDAGTARAASATAASGKGKKKVAAASAEVG